jgi:SdpC family antimicrobial peptide
LAVSTTSISAVPISHLDESAVTQQDSVEREPYSDLDVVMLFLAGRGPIAERYPDLADTLVPNKAPQQPQAAYQAVLDQLLTVDPAFHENVTVPIQSGDPYLSEAALERFRSDILLFAPAQPSGVGMGRCAIGVWFFVASAVAVVVAAVVGAVAVPVYAVYYVPDESAKQFDLQKFAGALASTFRSA